MIISVGLKMQVGHVQIILSDHVSLKIQNTYIKLNFSVTRPGKNRRGKESLAISKKWPKIPGEAWPRKGIWGCMALKTPFFHASPAARKGPISSQESVHKTPFWENLEILASTASIFVKIIALKPPNLEIFSSQAPTLELFSSQAPKFGNYQFTSPPFQRQISVRKPHTSEIRAAHPYLKKSWVPPRPKIHFEEKSFAKSMSTL